MFTSLIQVSGFFRVIGFKKYGVFVLVQSSVVILHEESIMDWISCFLIKLHFFSPPDTNMWTSLVSPLLCSRPRAGHSMMLLGSDILRDTGTHEQDENVKIQCALLVFGGSDCSGSFYDDTIKCTVEIPFDKWFQIVFSHHGPRCDLTWEERFVWKTNSSALCFVALIMYLCVFCVILLLYVSSKITIRQRAANSETRGFPLCIANLWALCFTHYCPVPLLHVSVWFWRQIKVIVQFHAKILINIFLLEPFLLFKVTAVEQSRFSVILFNTNNFSVALY